MCLNQKIKLQILASFMRIFTFHAFQQVFLNNLVQLCMESGINEEKKNESMDFEVHNNTSQFLEKTTKTWI